MFRTPLIAALTVALLGGTALAQPANAPPSNLNAIRPIAHAARRTMTMRMVRRPAIRAVPAGSAAGHYQNGRSKEPLRQAQQAQADRDMFCRRDAAARTGYTTPREAARDEQTRGTVGGTLGGAALGAVLGAAAGNAGLGAAAGAGAGLIAGTAIGADNARHAAQRCPGRLCRRLLWLHA